MSEAEGVPFVMATIAARTVVHADEANHWDALEAKYLTKRINHSEAYSHDGACTNAAESFFSRIRRAEVGILRIRRHLTYSLFVPATAYGDRSTCPDPYPEGNASRRGTCQVQVAC